MRMHTKFSRYKGPAPSGAILLGADGAVTDVPTGAPQTSDPSVLICPFTNAAGVPFRRIAVAYKGPASAPDLSAQLWLWDSASEAWYAAGDPVTLKANRISFFEGVALAEPPQVATSSGVVRATAGSFAGKLVVADAGAVNGEYVFSMGPDLAGKTP